MEHRPKISVITPTVLGDFSIFDQPDVHILDYVPRVLEQQDFPLDEIELVVVDALWTARRDFYGRREYPFRIEHLPPRSNWITRNRKTNHARMRNTGLCVASGELVFLVDDTLSFGPGTLRRIWEEYQAGYCISPLVEWCYGQRHVGSNVDWRVGWLKEMGLRRWIAGPATPEEPDRPHKPIGFGIVSYPLELALDLGGYNEWFDGGGQYVDTDFGVRLSMWCQEATGGRIRGLAIDDSFWCKHEAHELPDPRAVLCYDSTYHSASMFATAIKCNRTIWHAQRQTGRYPRRANTEPPSRELYRFWGACPFYRETNAKMDAADGLPALQWCAPSNLPCKVAWLATQGETDDLREWVAHLEMFDLPTLRRQLREAVGLEPAVATDIQENSDEGTQVAR